MPTITLGGGTEGAGLDGTEGCVDGCDAGASVGIVFATKTSARNAPATMNAGAVPITRHFRKVI